MRHFLGLFAFLLTFSASAEVVAGRRLVLIHDQWAPSGGGPVTSLGAPVESAAFDGERFLTVWREGDVLRIALFEEGAVSPAAEASIDAPDIGAPFVRWDGNRYVVAGGGHPGVLAIVSPLGTIESSTALEATFGLADVAASPSGIALLLHYATDSHSGVVDVVLLDTTYRVASRTTVGSIVKSNGGGATWIATPKLVPFGFRFYAVWREARAGRYDNVVGAPIDLDGSAPAATLLETAYTYPSPYALFLHPYGSRMVVNAVREWGMGLTTTLVDEDGRPTPVTGYFGTYGLPAMATVRMLDGSIVAIYVVDGVANVRPLLTQPALPGRRRSARH